MNKFHLSVVATTRNDNHGGDLTYRMQHFIDGFVAQCKKHDLHAELILVEWNPPENTRPLSEALQFPPDKGPCRIRIIRVPKEIHSMLEHSEKIPLYQMIGKNVGIRRALGDFVLATNIDILFSDEIIIYLRDRLKTGILYRVDRLDIPSDLPKTDHFDEILKFSAKNFFRINGKYGTVNRSSGQSAGRAIYVFFLNRSLKTIISLLRTFRSSISVAVSLILNEMRYSEFREKLSLKFLSLKMRLFYNLHTNACGDFTLLSHSDWANLKGYPEWNIFSWHLDSVFLHQASKNGIKEKDLPRKMPVYHIEHGRGYTPEGAAELFLQLDRKNIPYLSNTDFLDIVYKMDRSKIEPIFNDAKWGMADHVFDEVWI